MKQIALFCGSFNPVTERDVKIAMKVLRFVNEVWLIPCHNSIYGKKIISFEHRSNMIKSVLPHKKIKVYNFDIENNFSSLDDLWVFLTNKYKKLQFYFIINNGYITSLYRKNIINSNIKFIVISFSKNKDNNSEWFMHKPHKFIKINDNGSFLSMNIFYTHYKPKFNKHIIFDYMTKHNL